MILLTQVRRVSCEPLVLRNRNEKRKLAPAGRLEGTIHPCYLQTRRQRQQTIKLVADGGITIDGDCPCCCAQSGVRVHVHPARLRYMSTTSLRRAICPCNSSRSWDAISFSSSGSSVAAARAHSSRIRSAGSMDRTTMPPTLDDIYRRFCERFAQMNPRRFVSSCLERTQHKGHPARGRKLVS